MAIPFGEGIIELYEMLLNRRLPNPLVVIERSVAESIRVCVQPIDYRYRDALWYSTSAGGSDSRNIRP